MTLAFVADRVLRWMMPEPNAYIAVFRPFVNLFGGKCFETGTADVIGDFAGVAQWLPPGVSMEDAPIVELFEQNLHEPVLGDLMNVFDQMTGYHPTGPHWYLALIGVDPARQGQGLGSALLKHGLARCDQAQELAYLEATNQGCRELYLRMGFRQLGEISSGDFPPLYPMLREPR